MPQSARLRFGHGLIAVVLCLGLMVVSPASAETQTPDPDPGSAATDLPIWQRTLYKTLTYQAVANLSDVALYNLLIGGSAATAGSFFAANALSAAALYYGFEYTWQSLRPPPEETDAAVLAEKTVLYRVINSTRNFVLGYTFSGTLTAAGGFVVANFVTDTAIFVGNEYVWDIMEPSTIP